MLLPAPLGPRNPKISPPRHLERHLVHRRKVSEAAGQVLHPDRGAVLPAAASPAAESGLGQSRVVSSAQHAHEHVLDGRLLPAHALPGRPGRGEQLTRPLLAGDHIVTDRMHFVAEEIDPQKGRIPPQRIPHRTGRIGAHRQGSPPASLP